MNSFLGTWTLLRTTLRRDRKSALIWIGLFALMAASTASRYAKMFPDERTIRGFVGAANHMRALVAMTGPIPSATIGGLVAYKIGSTVFNMVALMALFGVVRNTRAEEESGRAELIASGFVGRRAPLAAALLATFLTSVGAAAVTSIALISLHLPARGSVLLGLEMLSAGLFFGSLAAVTAQIASTGRGANTLAGFALGASYMTRLTADATGTPWLHWFSPEGWIQKMQAFGTNRIEVFALPVIASALLTAASFVLLDRRDHGAGLWPAREGAGTGERLTTPLALAWRLHRTSVLAWCGGMFAFALLTGGLAGNVPQMMSSASGNTRQLFVRFGGSSPDAITNGFLWLMALFFGYVIALVAVLAVLRLRSEETSGNAELLLSASVSRTRWVASHVIVAVLAPVAILGLSGLAIGLVHGLGAHDMAGRAPKVILSVLIQSPAIWVLAGVATVGFGWFPRYSVAIGWAVFLFVNVFGSVLSAGMGVQFERLGRLDPFRHLPNVLSANPQYGPVALLVAIAAVFIAAGMIGARRRDLG